MTKYLQYETRDRKPNERDLWDLHRLRIEGAATELDYDSWNMREALTRKVLRMQSICKNMDQIQWWFQKFVTIGRIYYLTSN